MNDPEPSPPLPLARLVVFWAIVGIPLLWGVANTLEKAMLLFRS